MYNCSPAHFMREVWLPPLLSCSSCWACIALRPVLPVLPCIALHHALALPCTMRLHCPAPSALLLKRSLSHPSDAPHTPPCNTTRRTRRMQPHHAGWPLPSYRLAAPILPSATISLPLATHPCVAK